MIIKIQMNDDVKIDLNADPKDYQNNEQDDESNDENYMAYFKDNHEDDNTDFRRCNTNAKTTRLSDD